MDLTISDISELATRGLDLGNVASIEHLIATAVL